MPYAHCSAGGGSGDGGVTYMSTAAVAAPITWAHADERRGVNVTTTTQITDLNTLRAVFAAARSDVEQKRKQRGELAGEIEALAQERRRVRPADLTKPSREWIGVNESYHQRKAAV